VTGKGEETMLSDEKMSDFDDSHPHAHKEIDRDELISKVLQNKLNRVERKKITNVRLIKREEKEQKISELIGGIEAKMRIYEQLVTQLIVKQENLERQLLSEREDRKGAEGDLQEANKAINDLNLEIERLESVAPLTSTLLHAGSPPAHARHKRFSLAPLFNMKRSETLVKGTISSRRLSHRVSNPSLQQSIGIGFTPRCELESHENSKSIKFSINELNDLTSIKQSIVETENESKEIQPMHSLERVDLLPKTTLLEG